jgi:hypothetical protein
VAPVPLMILEAGEADGVLFVTRIVALRPPAASGLNVTVIVQDPPTGMATVQLFVCEKSPGFDPPMATPLIWSGAVPLGRFSTVNDLVALEAPIIVDGNTRLSGETKIFGTAGAVVPERGTAAAGALLMMFKSPANVPAAVGDHFRVTVQFAPAASVAGQSLVCEKLESPDTDILLMANELNPMLEIVIMEVVFWPGEIEAKVTEFFESVNTGSAGAGTDPVAANDVNPSDNV